MIEYRKAEPKDIEELSQMRADFLVATENIAGEEEKEMIRNATRDFLNKTLFEGNFVQWLAVDNGKIIACSSISFYWVPPNKGLDNGKNAYIENMYTYDEYRGKGLGRKLLDLVVQEAKERGCLKVSLHATDAGRPLYVSYGFKNGEHEMYYELKR